MRRDARLIWGITVVLLSVMAVASIVADDAAGMSQAGEYVTYTVDAFDDAADQQRVLFFHAGWCPTCRRADRAFRDSASDIPEDVVLFRVNYDTQRDLRQRYAITYQHSFVLVDGRGEIVRRWAGGDIDRLLSELQG